MRKFNRVTLNAPMIALSRSFGEYDITITTATPVELDYFYLISKFPLGLSIAIFLELIIISIAFL